MRSSANHSAYLPSRWRDYAAEEIEKAKLHTSTGPWSPGTPSQITLDRAYALIHAIKQDLSVPLTSTSPDGVICFELRQPDRKLVFYINDDGSIEFYMVTPHRSPAEGEIRIDRLVEQANDIVDMFMRR